MGALICLNVIHPCFEVGHGRSLLAKSSETANHVELMRRHIPLGGAPAIAALFTLQSPER